MKPTHRLLRLTAVVTALGASLAAHAGLITFSDSGSGHYTASAGSPGLPLSQVIPDNNPSGVAFALNFTATGLRLTDISFTLTTAGGWNGDIYAYLSHGDGFAVLLNRVGASSIDADGYSASGFSTITLRMSATTDIHGVASPTTEGGPYAADGRLAYTDTARNNTLGVFDNMNPSGAWTLFFSDRSALNTTTLMSWRLDITAVPEPVNVALGCFGGVGVVVMLVRRTIRSRQPQVLK
jgi:hypothetical protein